jgi:hypothetical protein
MIVMMLKFWEIEEEEAVIGCTKKKKLQIGSSFFFAQFCLKHS